MKKTNRKTFIRQSAILAATPFVHINEPVYIPENNPEDRKPLVISTWSHGMPANAEAWKFLSTGKNALDAVEAGVRIPEADPEVNSVGLGGYPDATGKVTLDACIMDWKGRCGAVSYLENIIHPISVARKVMENTDHVMLCGQGALDFALKNGFVKENLLTEKAEEAYKKWLAEKPTGGNSINSENHDTIGMLALDEDGQIAGACTTSGLAWKLNGRVGDSPIIGAGLFVDGKVGGAIATGKGEAVIKIAGTAIIVELMRQGQHPQLACETAINRIVRSQPDFKSFQVGFLAVNLYGDIGAFSIHKGFQYALHLKSGNTLTDAPHLL